MREGGRGKTDLRGCVRERERGRGRDKSKAINNDTKELTCSVCLCVCARVCVRVIDKFQLMLVASCAIDRTANHITVDREGEKLYHLSYGVCVCIKG